MKYVLAPKEGRVLFPGGDPPEMTNSGGRCSMKGGRKKGFGEKEHLSEGGKIHFNRGHGGGKLALPGKSSARDKGEKKRQELSKFVGVKASASKIQKRYRCRKGRGEGKDRSSRGSGPNSKEG